jgi:hypothetical protein
LNSGRFGFPGWLGCPQLGGSGFGGRPSPLGSTRFFAGSPGFSRTGSLIYLGSSAFWYFR